jgi:hypothetical protein
MRSTGGRHESVFPRYGDLLVGRERWRLRRGAGRVAGSGSVLLEADSGSGKLLARGESMRLSNVRGSGKPFCRTNTNMARRRWPGANGGVLCSGRHRSHAPRGVRGGSRKAGCGIQTDNAWPGVRDQWSGAGTCPSCSGWRQWHRQWHRQWTVQWNVQWTGLPSWLLEWRGRRRRRTTP